MDRLKRADLSFKDVTFEEVVAGIKYWQLKATTAKINKSTEIATLRQANGTFFKKGRAVLCFKSPAAIWDMKNKQIVLDKPLGYDVVIGNDADGMGWRAVLRHRHRECSIASPWQDFDEPSGAALALCRVIESLVDAGVMVPPQ